MERVIGESDRIARRIFCSPLKGKEVRHLIEGRCKKEEISPRELQMGSHRGSLSKIRSDLAFKLVVDYGLPLEEIGRRLGVSTSAISHILRRKKKEKIT